jgi:HlyD family secretion protein
MLRLTGELVSRIQVKVYARVGGMISTVHFSEGTSFQTGQVMAELESREYALEVEEVEAHLEAASSRLAAMEAGGRPEERARAAAVLEARRSTVSLSQQEYDRVKRLQGAGGATDQKLEAALEQLEVARSRLIEARKMLEITVQGPRSEDKQAARAEVRRVRARLELAKIRLGYTKVLAPFDGVVGRRLVDPGQYVLGADSPQAPVLCIFSNNAVIRAVLDLPEHKLPFVRLGQEVRIFVQATGEQAFLGKVSNLYPFVDPATRMGKLEVEIPNDPTRLLAGMFVRGELESSPTPARTADEFRRGLADITSSAKDGEQSND